jgi:hypothetical protein
VSKIVRTKPAEQIELAELKRDPLLSASPQQIDAWVDANVTSLAGARATIKKLAKAIAILARRVDQSG